MTHDLWATLNFKMYEYLASVTLHDLVTRNAHKAIEFMKPIADQRLGPRPRAKIMAVGA
jgi:Rrf2 family iron-sulfur cluster assembly transcriptional regulator